MPSDIRLQDLGGLDAQLPESNSASNPLGERPVLPHATTEPELPTQPLSALHEGSVIRVPQSNDPPTDEIGTGHQYQSTPPIILGPPFQSPPIPHHQSHQVPQPPAEPWQMQIGPPPYYGGSPVYGETSPFAHPEASPWPVMNYRPDLGHRSPHPVNRNPGLDEYGQTFDFETKREEYPPLSEILATGRYFASASAMYIRPSFQANTSLFRNLSGVAETFEFSYKLAPHFQIGFESQFGPGIEFEYLGYHDVSSQTTFTSNGVESGSASAWLRGANEWTRLTADDVNERLSTAHRMELDVIGVSFFKEVALKKARINGKFGFQTAHIIHELVADVRTPSTVVGALRARSDTRVFGPRFLLEYFRPIGHTRLEFLTSVGGSVMFGEQSQTIQNTAGPSQSRLNAQEFMLTIDYFSGVQYRKMFAENRYLFARGGVLYQAWIHGGTAVLPQDDFGLRGFSFTAGVNR